MAALLLVGGLVLVASTSPGTAAAAPVITHWYRIPAHHAVHGGTRSTWSSSNWSGYAETGHFTSISGRWTVPAVTAGASDKSSSWFSSAWLGIDGFNNRHLIQTGTEQDFYAGSAHYSAWWEILPKAETVIPDAVSPGDEMSATIEQTAITVGRRKKVKTVDWTIRLQDISQGWTFATTEVYKGPGDSAEFIVESPLVGGSIATIPDYQFAQASARDGDFNSATVATAIGGPLTTAGLNWFWDAGTLVQNGVQVSTPGIQDPAGTAFNSSYGDLLPPAPTS